MFKRITLACLALFAVVAFAACESSPAPKAGKAQVGWKILEGQAFCPGCKANLNQKTDECPKCHVKFAWKYFDFKNTPGDVLEQRKIAIKYQDSDLYVSLYTSEDEGKLRSFTSTQGTNIFEMMAMTPDSVKSDFVSNTTINESTKTAIVEIRKPDLSTKNYNLVLENGIWKLKLSAMGGGGGMGGSR